MTRIETKIKLSLQVFSQVAARNFVSKKIALGHSDIWGKSSKIERRIDKPRHRINAPKKGFHVNQAKAIDIEQKGVSG